MRKEEFLEKLREQLSGLSQEDILERLNFYSEMIDDHMEEGLTEEEAVQAVGCIEEIAADVDRTKQSDTPRKQWKAWEIVLLAVGCPVWLSLLIAALAVAFSLYISLWSVIISLWAVFGSLAACAVAGAVAGVIFLVDGNGVTGVAVIGAAFACAGFAILLFYGSRIATKCTAMLTGILLKRFFRRKERT